MSLTTSLQGHGPGLPVLAAKGLGILLLVAVLVVYLVLGVLYEASSPADHPLRPALGRPRRTDHPAHLQVDLSLYAFVASSC